MNNVHNAFAAAQKRRLSDGECKKPDTAIKVQQEHSQPKQRKTDSDKEPSQQPIQQHNLLNICNELLYEIFKYLDTSSILALMHCSPRFECLLLDRRFWHNIDLSTAPLPLGILEEILGRATQKTHTIKICGPPSSQHVAGEFKQFTCTLTAVFPRVADHLKVLELQGVSLDFEYIHISEFPASLTRLVLKDCSVKVGDHLKSIFHTIEKQLIALEDLSIEDNDWFEPHYIMAISKLPSLRRLSLKGCQMFSKFVPYGSMAARFGFQKLEVLDLRITPINNSDLQCFSAIETLRELLLESPPNMPQEVPLVNKPCHGDGNDDVPIAPEPPKVLNDDEPSTSRAAMEHLRACKLAENRAAGIDVASSDTISITVSSNNGNEPKDNDSKRASNQTKHGGLTSSEADDEDSSSTSASSSDKSDSNAALSNGHSSDNNSSVQSPLVVITLPRVGQDISPPPGADNAENPENGDNPENPAAAAGAARCIYLQNGVPAIPGQNVNTMAIVNCLVDQVRNLRGNNPARSRFLPRRDQVIYMNPQPLLVMHSRQRQRSHPPGNLEQVTQHPMFWNIVDPLESSSLHVRRLRCRHPPTGSHIPQYYVSDRAMYSFGRARNPVQPDVVWIRHANRSPNNRLERISLRNYTHITNFTLEHLVQCSPNLRYIDVSGTAVTILGVRNFKNIKPECEVIATHLAMEQTAEATETTETPPAELDEVEPQPTPTVETDQDVVYSENEQSETEPEFGAASPAQADNLSNDDNDEQQQLDESGMKQ